MLPYSYNEIRKVWLSVHHPSEYKMPDPATEFFTVTQISRADIAKALTDELDDMTPESQLSRTIVFANNAQLTDDFCTRYARAIGAVVGNPDSDVYLERISEVRRNFLGELGLLPNQVENLTEAAVDISLRLKLKWQGKMKFSRHQAETLTGQGVEVTIRKGLQGFLDLHRALFDVEIDGISSAIDEDALRDE